MAQIGEAWQLGVGAGDALLQVRARGSELASKEQDCSKRLHRPR